MFYHPQQVFVYHVHQIVINVIKKQSNVLIVKHKRLKIQMGIVWAVLLDVINVQFPICVHCVKVNIIL